MSDPDDDEHDGHDQISAQGETKAEVAMIATAPAMTTAMPIHRSARS
ncbi:MULTISPECIES: hypothetical protein [Streptomyces]|uniref:Uncharacterized protein n=1 Tax=Streptomyces morookaense TaxID=1970 RepID=A0A7Y7B7T6_STRMO|nr:MULTISPECIES: hypothetical protein [Streptomyces]MCC2280381.1 hypothetical protein [Streptomyces sp. ET3-23]NVK80608.1 hypothetical protein [Streptomyces morookaense]